VAVLRLRLVTAGPREAWGTARQALRPGCEELAARVAEDNAADGSAAPGQKSPRWSAERRASLRRKRVHARLTRAMGTQGASQAPGRAAARPTGCRCTRAPVGAPPSLHRGGHKFHTPGAIAPRERDRLFDIVRRECSARRAHDALDRPHALSRPRAEEHRSATAHRQCSRHRSLRCVSKHVAARIRAALASRL
jgi:hypothetical protein